MGDRGGPPSKRMTMADFLRPPPKQPPPTTMKLSNNISSSNSNNNLSSSVVVPSYTVRATKKGGVPCVVESRKHHKVVVLTNIGGNVSALLSALQKSLGAGGKVGKGNTSIEVQGEHHLEKVKKFVVQSGCMVGASQQIKTDYDTTAKQPTNNNNSPKSDVCCSKAMVKSAVLLSVKEIKAMKPTELKVHLTTRQLSTQGNKKELLARLLLAAVPL